MHFCRQLQRGKQFVDRRDADRLFHHLPYSCYGGGYGGDQLSFGRVLLAMAARQPTSPRSELPDSTRIQATIVSSAGRGMFGFVSGKSLRDEVRVMVGEFALMCPSPAKLGVKPIPEKKVEESCMPCI